MKVTVWDGAYHGESPGQVIDLEPGEVFEFYSDQFYAFRIERTAAEPGVFDVD
jgi:hypothetical protein